jgi:hypothetical protein
MKKDHFEKANKALNGLEDLGVKLGSKPETINPVNALRSVTKAVTDLDALNSQAQKMGYTSAAVALKALSQIKDPLKDYAILPEVFHKVPAIWLDGRPRTRTKDGFNPMTVSQAQRAHRTIIPLILEAWDLAKDDEAILNDILIEYQRTSAEDFKKSLYKYIYDLEPQSLEDELRDWELEPTTSEIMKSSREATVDSNVYGIGGEMEEIVWEDK